MCLFIESIKIKDGQARHLDLHQDRMDRSIAEIYRTPNRLKISKILKNYEIPASGLYKGRIVYDLEVRDFQIIAYQPKKIKSVRAVDGDHIEYSYKYENREVFKKLLDRNSDVDEIIIIKKGLISDSSYSNLVFWDGHHWITPSSPLLQGVQREYLLAEKKIISRKIRLSDLAKYERIGFINAMMDLNDMPVIGMEKLF